MIKISQSQLDMQEIDRVYDELIAPVVVAGLKTIFANEPTYACHANPNVYHGFLIAAAFLRKYNLDPGRCDEASLKKNVLDYLLGGKTNPQQYLESIILSFWRCAADHFVEMHNNINLNAHILYLNDSEVEALSKWTAFKEAALGDATEDERRKFLLSVLNQHTIHLFVDVTDTDISRWKSGKGNITKTKIRSIDLAPDLSVSLRGELNQNGKPKKDFPCALQMLETVFNYAQINEKDENTTPRHQLLSSMKVPVCPYCNRQYITMYSTEIKKTRKSVSLTTADLDHFYIKSEYPYLSLSLFNFIPSCQICNSRFKGTTDFYLYPHVYPYEEEFGDDAKFSLKLDASLMDDKANWDRMIELSDKSGEDAVRNSISTFMLEQVYQSHGDYVHEIWVKSKAYSKDKIESLKAEYGDLLGDNRSIMDLIYGQYLDQSQMYLRPLSKLTKDILEECYDGEIDWKSL